MKSIHVRNIDEETLDALKRLAGKHHRSLQGELHSILEKAALKAPPAGDAEEIKLITVKSGRNEKWSRENMYGNDAR